MPGHHHRSGTLRQSNKKNKRTKASKRSFSRLNGGKVQEGHGRIGFKQQIVAYTKADRRHFQQQKRDAKRAEILRRKRGIDGGPPPARIVGIISLGNDEEQLEERVRSLIVSQADKVARTFGSDDDDNNDNENGKATVTTKYEIHKKDGNLTVLTNSTSFRSHYSKDGNMSPNDCSVLSALDMCRVCDIILFVIDGNGARDDDNVLGMSVGPSDEDPSVSTKRSNATSVQDWDHLISERGDRVLSAVKGQGLPRIITLLARTEHDPDPEGADDLMTTQSAKSIRRSNVKRKADLKKYVSRFATTEFGVNNEKVVEVDLTVQDDGEIAMDEDNEAAAAATTTNAAEHVRKTLAASFVRTLCTISASASKWVSQLPRSHILSDNHTYDASAEELHITGYIRGLAPFDVNSLMHVPNLGTFHCKSLKRARHPYYRKKGNGMDAGFDEKVIHSDPETRESLQMFATPDALDGEQNLIGFDGDDDDDGNFNDDDNKKEGDDDFARPAGWSDYQSAWLGAVDENSLNGDEFDHGELAKQLNQKSSSATASVAPIDDAMELEDANQVSEEERKALLEQRRKEEQEHQEFPDEVQVMEDENAKDRFARYRSLKNFRKSHWDPKENLPDSYAAIYHFANFRATQRSVMLEMKDLMKASDDCGRAFWDGELKQSKSKGGDGADVAMISEEDEDDDDILEGCVPTGSYVTITLEKVSQEAYNGISADSLLSLVSLLPHENKVSVVHMGLSKTSTSDSETPIKSKDTLIFRCGWRTWSGRPVFSQHNLNSDKHKMERFMPPPGGFFAASVFGPVTYTPSPVLVFRQKKTDDADGGSADLEMVAIGSMLGSDADRIVIKRIVLTGYPVRVHKRFATVKYMFYKPEDVKWFKPAGLVTKHGLQGNIEDCIGDHGTMKCLFNAPIKQHDTVCLPLYKRIFPKFVPVNAPSGGDGDDTRTMRSIRNRDVLIVK